MAASNEGDRNYLTQDAEHDSGSHLLRRNILAAFCFEGRLKDSDTLLEP